MAEFCLDCLNEINKTNDPPKKYIISKDFEICESCGEVKNVVVVLRKARYVRLLKRVLFPLRVILFPAEFLIRVGLAVIRLIRKRHIGK